MLTSNRLYLALALVTTAALGCGGDEGTVSSNGSTSSSSGAGGQGGSSSASSSSSSGTGGAGGGVTCPANEGTVFAVKSLVFGEGNSGEWKKVGWNLDGLISTGTSTDVCMPSSGGQGQTAYPDGDEGIDNSFGKNLLPTILLLYPTWVTDINTGINNGNFSALVKVDCLPAEGDAPQLNSRLFGATKLATPPKWDGTDIWPVEPGLLSDPMDPLSSTITFPNTSIKADVFDAGKDVTFILSVPVRTAMKETSIKLTLYHAKMTMNLSADRKSGTSGMLGGVLNTEEFVAEIKKIGELMGLCTNPLFSNLVTQVRQASDIMADGSQDPTKTCDGITMGLGFEMQAAQIGDVGPANPVGAACQ